MSLSGEALAFGDQWNVSRETSERLDLYVALLRKWNCKINLVSPRSLDAVWTRHIADSAQLLALAKGRPGVWGDLGSGGGLAGNLLARQLKLQIARIARRTSVTITSPFLMSTLRRISTSMGDLPRTSGMRKEIVSSLETTVHDSASMRLDYSVYQRQPDSRALGRRIQLIE